MCSVLVCCTYTFVFLCFVFRVLLHSLISLSQTCSVLFVVVQHSSVYISVCCFVYLLHTHHIEGIVPVCSLMCSFVCPFCVLFYVLFCVLFLRVLLCKSSFLLPSLSIIINNYVMRVGCDDFGMRESVWLCNMVILSERVCDDWATGYEYFLELVKREVLRKCFSFTPFHNIFFFPSILLVFCLTHYV